MDNFWNSSQGPFDLNDDSQGSAGFLNTNSVPLGAFLNNPLFPQNTSSMPYPSFAQNNPSVPLVDLESQFSPIAHIPQRTHTLTTALSSEPEYAMPPSTNCSQAQPPTKSKGKGKKKAISTDTSEGGSHRSVNYTREEDLCLISAWLNVSRDPIVGTNQSHDAYLERVTKYYD
ncbi:hypothetical protein BS78_06G274100 [Paspalum vaginatum]|nr:hypothetical protein BS78_06G274100 [Paspalum vaginatum]